MSEGFHVHGPHDHEVEHKAHAGDPMAARVAVMTAILATIGALISYQGCATQNAGGGIVAACSASSSDAFTSAPAAT